MQFKTTPLPGIIIIEPDVFGDDRGYFFESFHKEKFAEAGISEEFVQDNQSLSSYGTLRGLHFQKPPYAQSKLVRVIKGEVYDVVVDVRPDSQTFGQSFGVTLSEKNNTMMYIPIGFAHGFCTMANDTIFVYKCGNVYHKESEGGIIWNDADLKIEWPIDKKDIIVSEKDAILSSFEEIKKELIW